MPKQKKYIALRSITMWQRAEITAPNLSSAQKKARGRRVIWATTAADDYDPVVIDPNKTPLVLGPRWGNAK